MTNNKHNQFLHQGESLLPAIAYGDAAGLPVETRSAEYIAEHYGVIRELIGSSENPFYLGKYQPGLWSDDTQLSLAVAEALIEADGFDLATQAEQHIHAYNQTPEMERRGIIVKRGWGRSTTGAMERLKSGVSPEVSGTKDGAGNGILMKLAPLVYWQVARETIDEERYEQYDQLTTMTHDSDIARATTRVHGDVLRYLLTQPYDRADFADIAQEAARRHSEAFAVPLMEIADRFRYLASAVDKETILSQTDSKGFYAPQTLAMAYGAYLTHGGEFAPSVYEAVNLGGDTDSTASIVAAMSTFATRELVRLPVDHQNIDQLPMLQRVSRQFARQALENV